MEKDLASLMEGRLASLDSTFSKYYISKVPEHIRKENEQAYKPLTISIGPIHYGDPTLELMQKLKWQLLNWFLLHPSNAHQGNLEYFINFIRQRQSEIRECYEDKISAHSDDTIIQMILLDAVFIIYSSLGAGHSELKSKNVPGKLLQLYEIAHKDLFLIENQLPFFIVQDLYDISFASALSGYALPNFICILMGTTYFFRSPGYIKNIFTNMKFEDPRSIKHLVHLYWICCLDGLKLRKQPRDYTTTLSKRQCTTSTVLNIDRSRYVEHIKRVCCLQLQGSSPRDPQSDCTTSYDPRILSLTLQELKASGVKIVVNQSPLVLNIQYKKGVLEIPRIYIDEFTEPVLRSVLYFEQCHSVGDTYIADYLQFLDYLIDTEKDVRILVDNGILVDNCLGSDKAVADLMNSVTKYNGMSYKRYYYSDVRKDLEAFAKRPWNKWMAILRRQYFSHPWTVISLIGALFLFILTLIQTINSFK